jgi:predicted SprT family Zn-dependent metalloprotease
MTDTVKNPRKLLTPALKLKVEQRVLEVFNQAKALYPEHAKEFDELPEIRYDVKNRVGGMAITGGRDDWTIRLNLILCYENEEDFIKQTVGHECAHLICRRVHGNTKQVAEKGQMVTKKVRSHGKEWKSVMVKLDLKPKTYHTYDTSSIETRGRRRAKRGELIPITQVIEMIKRLQNGYKRLPDDAKIHFAEWVADIQQQMDDVE